MFFRNARIYSSMPRTLSGLAICIAAALKKYLKNRKELIQCFTTQEQSFQGTAAILSETRLRRRANIRRGSTGMSISLLIFGAWFLFSVLSRQVYICQKGNRPKSLPSLLSEPKLYKLLLGRRTRRPSWYLRA